MKQRMSDLGVVFNDDTSIEKHDQPLQDCHADCRESQADSQVHVRDHILAESEGMGRQLDETHRAEGAAIDEEELRADMSDAGQDTLPH
jgi:hypothetical protein